jgi:hypothetical protein
MYNIIGLLENLFQVPTEMVNSSYKKRRARDIKPKGRIKFVNILTKDLFPSSLYLITCNQL